MNSAHSLTVVQQTMLILLPELILLASAIVMMTGSAFIARPRRFWCAMSAGAVLFALFSLLFLGRMRTDLYAAVALNDDLSFYARLVILVSAGIVLGLAHREPSDARAGEFFGSLLMMYFVKITVGLRVSKEGELEGLDLHEHGGGAYPELVGSSHGFVLPEEATGTATARAVVPSPAT